MATPRENPYDLGSDIYTNRDVPLTELKLTFEGGSQEDNSATSGDVEVIFRNQDHRLTMLIAEASNHGWLCFGAVAWLTDLNLLSDLGNLLSSILVQKEDFLRPDLGQRSGGAWRNDVRKAYEAIPPVPCDRSFLPGKASKLSFLGGQDVGQAVRCVGERPSPNITHTHPRMHNKFLVFASPINRGILYDEEAEDSLHQLGGGWNAHVVWTGSYNLSKNAGHSWENALIIRDPVIAEAYLNEWSQLFTFSEPLDWRSEYIAPEWRIGS